MTPKPKILVIRDPQSQAQESLPDWGDAFEVVTVSTPRRGMVKMARESFAGVYISGQMLSRSEDLGRLLQNERILEGMPDGLLLLDADNTILWANETNQTVERSAASLGRELLHGLEWTGYLGPGLLSLSHGTQHRSAERFNAPHGR